MEPPIDRLVLATDLDAQSAVTIDIAKPLAVGEQHSIPIETEKRTWARLIHWSGPDGPAEAYLISLTLSALIGSG